MAKLRPPLPPDKRTAQQEAALLREAQGFFLGVAACLDGLMTAAHALWKRSVKTDAYKRVDGQDDGLGEPIWQFSATLESMFAEDLEEVISYLRQGARHAGAAAARRARTAAQLGPARTPPPQ